LLTGQRRTIIVAATTPGFFLDLLKSQFVELSKRYNLVLCCPAASELQKFCADNNILLEPLNIRRKPSIVSDVRVTIAVTHIIRKYRPALVMTYNPKAGFVFALAKTFYRRELFVHNFTGLIFPYAGGLKRLILASFDKFVLYTADVCVAESDGVAVQLRSLNVSSANIVKIGDGNVAGVDFSRFHFPDSELRKQARDSLGLVSEEIMCIFVGRITPDKGVLELIDAFSQVKLDRPELRLLLAGDADDNLEYYAAFENAITDQSGISHLGKRTDIPALMQAADFVVLPTRREGFSNTGLEAQASGVPLLINDVPGASETLSGEGLGVLMSGNGADSIADGIREMLVYIKDVDATKKYACAKRIKKAYSRDQVTVNYLSFVEKMLG